jgi:quinoprotein glucose dehydrogenase
MSINTRDQFLTKIHSPAKARIFTAVIPGLLAACLITNCNDRESYETWSVYRGDDGINAYSALEQINKENVKDLRVAWTFCSGDHAGNSTIQCNPIIVDHVLYGLTPTLKVFALDAETGRQIWIYDPFEGNDLQGGVSRGLTFWKDGNEGRIFTCASHRLIALDAGTGKQIMTFGENGFVDLRKGLRNDENIENYFIENTSPGVIFNNLIIIGSRMGETYGGLPGHIRAYDVITGALKWVFNTIPQPGEFGYDTWGKESYKTAGGCNAWSGLSIDKKRGMVFAATGAPSFDFHGGDRPGSNLFGNSVIALNASTGKYIWHFQVSHHDLWDYDLPSPPNLITVERNGKNIDAVAQITKQGWVFVLDREKGTPLFPVEEKPVPASTMADENTSPTQPFPAKPPALSRQKFDTSIVTDISPQAREFVLKQIEKFSWGSIYTPPSTTGIIQMPGFRGGGEWSGAAFDPETGIMYIGTNDIANMVQLEALAPPGDELLDMPVLKAGEFVYQKNCATCHGDDRKGLDPFPPLLNIERKLKVQEARTIIEKGRGKMPGFAALSTLQKDAVVAFLFGIKSQKLTPDKDRADSFSIEKKLRTEYKIKGYIQLKDQHGYPGVKPPWGLLNAVNLNSGEIVWKRPLGEFPELAQKGHKNTGTQLFGGSIVTAGGLIFIGASKDEKFRAIDKETGETLWEHQLPAGGYATPATYAINGKQYIVIAAGGGGLQATTPGDYYIAFALPDPEY